MELQSERLKVILGLPEVMPSLVVAPTIAEKRISTSHQRNHNQTMITITRRSRWTYRSGRSRKRCYWWGRVEQENHQCDRSSLATMSPKT